MRVPEHRVLGVFTFCSSQFVQNRLHSPVSRPQAVSSIMDSLPPQTMKPRQSPLFLAMLQARRTRPPIHRIVDVFFALTSL